MNLSSSSIRRSFAGLSALALALVPRAALACPVCFGALQGPVADGTNKAVLAMLGVTLSVLACFGGFFLYLVRRARALPVPAEPQEGRADGRVEEVEDYLEGAA